MERVAEMGGRAFQLNDASRATIAGIRTTSANQSDPRTPQVVAAIFFVSDESLLGIEMERSHEPRQPRW